MRDLYAEEIKTYLVAEKTELRCIARFTCCTRIDEMDL